MLLTLITAGIDLSVGATATFGACVAGAMVRMGVTNPVFLFIAVLVVGGVVGLINGLLLTRLSPSSSLRINPWYEELCFGEQP